MTLKTSKCIITNKLKQNLAGKFYAYLLCLLCALTLTGCQKKPDGVDVDGKSVSLCEYQGKWIVINYWASWCEHCAHELPELQTLAKNYPNKVCVLGVNFDGLTPEEIKKAQKNFGVTYPMLQQLSLEKYGVTAVDSLPTTFIICPQGILRATLHGPQTAAKIAQLTNLVSQ